MDENKSILIKIKSKYIFEHITSYIKEEYFIYKLIFFDKSFQKKLDLNNYFLDIFSREKIYIEEYLCCTHLNEIFYFNGSKLKNNYNNNLSRINIGEDISNFMIYNYFKKQIQSFKEKNKYKLIDIDFFSPYFEFLSKSNIFSKFNIIISFNIIKEYKLSEEYIINFKKMIKKGIKFPALEFDFEEVNDLKNELFNINTAYLGQIKKVKFIKQSQSENKKYNCDDFFRIFFSLFDYRSLVYLELNIFEHEKIFIDKNLFEAINNYKNLKYLKLIDFKFKTRFIFKLYNLQNLSLFSCENISFEDNSLSNLKHLELEDTKIEIKSKLKLKELEELIIHINNEVDYCNIIDFTSFNKLKYFKGHAIYFCQLKTTLLEQAYLYRNNGSLKDSEILQKLISIQTLKEFNIHLKDINNGQILLLVGKNSSVNKVNIRWDNDCILFDLQLCFPNSTELNLISVNKLNTFRNNLIIKENSNLKINKIIISLNSDTQIYCESFNKLISLDICSDKEIENIEELPIINDNNMIYNSLVNFSFNYSYIMKFNILNNIFNNINNMPNLRNFSLGIRLKEDIDENYFKKFIRKTLNLRFMKGIKIDFFSHNTIYYSLKELKTLFPDVNFNRFNTVTIRKLK